MKQTSKPAILIWNKKSIFLYFRNVAPGLSFFPKSIFFTQSSMPLYFPQNKEKNKLHVKHFKKVHKRSQRLRSISRSMKDTTVLTKLLFFHKIKDNFLERSPPNSMTNVFLLLVANTSIISDRLSDYYFYLFFTISL